MRTLAEVQDERAAVLAEKEELDDAIADIATQLDRAKADVYTGRGYSDPDWYHQATRAKRIKGRKSQKLQTQLGRLRREEQAIHKAQDADRLGPLWRIAQAVDSLQGDTTDAEAEGLWDLIEGAIVSLDEVYPDWRERQRARDAERTCA